MHENSLKLSEVQYCLWARILVTGVHSSKENPPQVPMITGSTPRRQVSQKKDMEASIISTAAAVVKAVTQQNSPCSSAMVQPPQINQTIMCCESTTAQDTGQGLGISPSKIQKFVVRATHSWLHFSSSMKMVYSHIMSFKNKKQ